MAVLIEGMEMPTEEYGSMTITIYPNGSVMEYIGDIGRSLGYAVPVPPHGRLIDADAYEALIRGLGNREYRRENGTICDAIKFLHPYYTPTIIEAEEVIQKDGGQDK